MKVFVSQRLTAAVEEIIGHLHTIITEYEEEMCRHRKLLDNVSKPEEKLQRAGLYNDTFIWFVAISHSLLATLCPVELH